MNIAADTPDVQLIIPISLFFWGYVFVYVIHILEESVFPEVFVEKVKRKYWKNYSWKRFFCFNALLLCLNTAAVIVYEKMGNNWIILPLALATERVFNGMYHLAETIITKRFSSGLLSSVMTFILTYLLIKYSIIKENIRKEDVIIGIIVGIIIGSLMIFPMVTGKLKNIK